MLNWSEMLKRCFGMYQSFTDETPYELVLQAFDWVWNLSAAVRSIRHTIWHGDSD